MIIRKDIQMEHEYANTAQGVRDKQHARLAMIATAYIQAYEWMPTGEHTADETTLYLRAKALTSVIITVEKEA
jgi:hypothetical protein